METDLESLRDEIRAYLAGHPERQTNLAKLTGISHSWLNKFINGQFQNLSVPRLNDLAKWVEKDRRERAEQGLPPVSVLSQRAPEHSNLSAPAA